MRNTNIKAKPSNHKSLEHPPLKSSKRSLKIALSSHHCTHLSHSLSRPQSTYIRTILSLPSRCFAVSTKFSHPTLYRAHCCNSRQQDLLGAIPSGGFSCFMGHCVEFVNFIEWAEESLAASDEAGEFNSFETHGIYGKVWWMSCVA